MINKALWQMTFDNVAKTAFIPAGAQQGMAPPPAPDPNAAAMGGAAPPQDPLAAQGGMPPPADPAMAGAAPPTDPAAAGAAPPADPAAAAAPPPADPATAPPTPAPGGDVKTQIVQALTEAGVIKPQGQSKGKKGGDPAALEMQARRTNKLLASLHNALGAPLPYDILDDEPPPEGGGGASGGSSSGGGESKSTPKQAVDRGAIQPVSGIQPAFDIPKVAEQADALLQLLRDNVR